MKTCLAALSTDFPAAKEVASFKNAFALERPQKTHFAWKTIPQEVLAENGPKRSSTLSHKEQ